MNNTSAAQWLQAANQFDSAGDWQQALDAYQQAYALEPSIETQFSIIYCKGKTAFSEDELHGVIELWNAFIAQQSAFQWQFAAFYNRGTIFRLLNECESAKQDFEHALQLNPQFTQARKALGLLKLMHSKNQDGWLEYQARYECETKRYPIPEWSAEQGIDCGVYLYAEQGLGDNIHFFRYALAAKKLGLNVVVKNHAALNDLLNFNLQAHGIKPMQGDGFSVQYQASLMDMPYLLAPLLPQIPDTQGYLKVQPEKLQTWQNRFQAANGLNIGVVWSSISQTTFLHYRNVLLPEFAVLFDSPHTFHCLQKEISAEDRAQLAQFENVKLWDENLNDFSDTAALIMQLDLVICVDTAVAHLAGALGKPVWILIPFSPDFRWLDKGERSIWYDSARLFRQQQVGDWCEPLAQVKQALNHFQAA
ncbi:glycosyltransferase family 9 protein [Kingella negevensis]|uniref:glycosyltransferase family 9 protein n=1 Tax=Kingella negevensis TaxID=1522312 RepID=UPI00254C729E|nr:glycosyltransferase family 9 protein [Kingella negevensis]MDK4681123.1 glycosyltransferase family 9 protein [Kingella negevensis]MDK4683325.1 glycosyltransferase family 9 protein [Kingella negevensis]MDK4691544.1 glycosyltransferase family 9 protein [Kingella negevensis]MDK4693305.1 glycosyltransferase family 9 protein [Kingella negevensis]MDK4699605.1 glycosyltransferase family 9 protein [Kingella negevensis]